MIISNRTELIRTKELNTLSLFNDFEDETCVDQSGLASLSMTQRPILKSPTYVIDLNIFFDVVRKRKDKEWATRLISAGLSNEIRVFVTPEFCFELRKHKKNEHDPLLEFAEQLPTLPKIHEEIIDKLISELKLVVFPERINADQKLSRNRSDLTHLAYCVHHGASGFITREKAILSACDQLNELYRIEVLSAADLIPDSPRERTKHHSLRVHGNRGELMLKQFEENQRESIENFLYSFQQNMEFVIEALSPGTSAFPRQRVVASLGDKILGFASWDNPKSIGHRGRLYLYVNESASEAEMIIDHIIEMSLRDSAPFSPTLISLHAGAGQSITRATALKRGFMSIDEGTGSPWHTDLIKFAFNGLVTKANWIQFREDFNTFAGFQIPDKIPTISEFTNTGIIVKAKNGKQSCLRLFDFETLISPGIINCPGRTAILVPIRKRYAQHFFVLPHTQLDMFFNPEALLHIEKAYFRSFRNASIFQRGGLVLFYISGSDGGTKEVIGCGRITFSEVLSVDKANLLLKRQGVLSREELKKIAGKHDVVHAFTFDNFSRFNNKISFSLLKRHNLISGANLITPQSLSQKDFLRICEMGFGNGEINHA